MTVSSPDHHLDGQGDDELDRQVDDELDRQVDDELDRQVDDELAHLVGTPLKHVAADHERLDSLFHTLDHNGDGFIDEQELIHYMTAFYGEEEGSLEEEAKVSRS